MICGIFKHVEIHYFLSVYLTIYLSRKNVNLCIHYYYPYTKESCQGIFDTQSVYSKDTRGL